MSFQLVQTAQEASLQLVNTQAARRFQVPLGNGMLISLKGLGLGINLCQVSEYQKVGEDEAVFFLSPTPETQTNFFREPIRASFIPSQRLIEVYGALYTYDIKSSHPISL